MKAALTMKRPIRITKNKIVSSCPEPKLAYPARTHISPNTMSTPTAIASFQPCRDPKT
jgi:hypothetical protein